MNQNTPSPSAEENNLTKKTREWVNSDAGKQALARAIKKSDEFKKRLNEMSMPVDYVDRTVINI